MRVKDLKGVLHGENTNVFPERVETGHNRHILEHNLSHLVRLDVSDRNRKRGLFVVDTVAQIALTVMGPCDILYLDEALIDNSDGCEPVAVEFPDFDFKIGDNDVVAIGTPADTP